MTPDMRKRIYGIICVMRDLAMMTLIVLMLWNACHGHYPQWYP